MNYYDVLGLSYDASEEQIQAAYRDKISHCSSELMHQRYDTAYYYLTDGKRRFDYDRSIGIHRYRRHGRLYSLLITVLRIILTITDALMTFYWCFLFCLAVYASACMYMRNGYISVTGLFTMYSDEIYILFLAALIDLAGHFYVRRANRYLKHRHEVGYNEYKKIKEKSRKLRKGR